MKEVGDNKDKGARNGSNKMTDINNLQQNESSSNVIMTVEEVDSSILETIQHKKAEIEYSQIQSNTKHPLPVQHFSQGSDFGLKVDEKKEEEEEKMIIIGSQDGSEDGKPVDKRLHVIESSKPKLKQHAANTMLGRQMNLR